MKVFYQALLDVYNEIEEETVKAGRSYRAHYAKEAVSIIQVYHTLKNYD